MQTAFEEAAHRHWLDKKFVQLSLAGLLSAYSLALLAVGGGIYLAASGAETGGVATIVTAVAGLVAVFTYGRRPAAAAAGKKDEEEGDEA